MTKATVGAIWTGTIALVVIAAALVLMLLVDFDVVALPATADHEVASVVRGLDGIESAVNHLRGGFAGLGGGSLSSLEERLQGICNVLQGASTGGRC
jgi:hypothetical protein